MDVCVDVTCGVEIERSREHDDDDEVCFRITESPRVRIRTVSLITLRWHMHMIRAAELHRTRNCVRCHLCARTTQKRVFYSDLHLGAVVICGP